MPTTTGLFPANRVTRIRQPKPPRTEAGAWSWGLQLLGESNHTEAGDLNGIGDAVTAAADYLDGWINSTPGAASLTHDEAVEILAQIRDALWKNGQVQIPGRLIGEHRGDLLCWVSHAGYGSWSTPVIIALPDVA